MRKPGSSILLFLPALVVFLGTRFFPAVYTFCVSLSENYHPFQVPELTGFANYAAVLSDMGFLKRYFLSLGPHMVIVVLAAVASVFIYERLIRKNGGAGRAVICMLLLPIFMFRRDVWLLIRAVLPGNVFVPLYHVSLFFFWVSALMLLYHVLWGHGDRRVGFKGVTAVLPLVAAFAVYDMLRYLDPYNSDFWTQAFMGFRFGYGAVIQLLEMMLLIAAGVLLLRCLTRNTPNVCFSTEKPAGAKQNVSGSAVPYVAGGVVVLIMLFPYLFSIVRLLSLGTQDLTELLSVLQRSSWVRPYFNSITRALLIAFAGTGLALFGGYYLSRGTGLARGCYYLVVITCFIGVRQIVIAKMSFFGHMGLLNAPLGPALFYIYVPLAMILFKLFFEGRELDLKGVIVSSRHLARLVFVYLFTSGFFIFGWVSIHATGARGLGENCLSVIGQFGNIKGVPEAAFIIATLPFVLCVSGLVCWISGDVIRIKVGGDKCT